MGKPEEAPPSYAEAISSSPQQHSSSNYTQPPPPQHPQRPQAHPSQSHTSFSSHTSSHSFSNHQQGPQIPQRPPQNSAQGYALPWTYPRGYHCSKCNNTGRKLKNGKSCQRCWERFAPRNNSSQIRPTVIYGSTTNSSMPFASPAFGTSFLNSSNLGSGVQSYSYGTQTTSTSSYTMPPRFVQPGDPSLGGIQCGKCRGTGLVRFLLNEEPW